MNKAVQNFVNTKVSIQYHDHRKDPNESREINEKIIAYHGKQYFRKRYFVGVPTMCEALYILGKKTRDVIEFSYTDGEEKMLGVANVFVNSSNGIFVSVWLDTTGEIVLHCLTSSSDDYIEREIYETHSCKEFLGVCRKIRDRFKL